MSTLTKKKGIDNGQHADFQKLNCKKLSSYSHKFEDPSQWTHKNDEYVRLLEDVTTEPHAQDISADILRVWLSGYILQQRYRPGCVFIC